MTRRHLIGVLCLSALGAIVSVVAAPAAAQRSVNGTIWVANRGAHTIRGFDADTGDEVRTVTMAAGSQPGDLAYAKGLLYVAEEFGAPPAIAVVDPQTGIVIQRITFANGARPHHVHASSGGNLVASGLYGTDLVAVIDTDDNALLGPWDSNPSTTSGRIHAGVFSNDGGTLYLTDDITGQVVALDPRSGEIFWRLAVPGAHELAVAHNQKLAYVSRRTFGKVSTIDLTRHDHFDDVLALGAPDTLKLSANEKLLTVGLRTMPAQMAVVETRRFDYQLVTLAAPGEATTVGGHQWTSASGRYTFASYEGGPNPGIAVIDHTAGNVVVQRIPYPGRPHGVAHANR